MTDFCEIGCEFATRKWRSERVGLAILNTRNVTKSENFSKIKSLKSNHGEFISNISYLKSLDPKKWKDQDHYAVLGLENLRFNATDDEIKRAFRRMVLQHHPDKRKANGEEVQTDEDYFTCITKAYEILGMPKTRRSYDSVDPEFDDSLPSQSDIENNFYDSFKRYFELNARWSEKKDVPSFGDENAAREDIEKFYTFWYNFKSWREFSYLDEEDKEKGQDRDERRWIEKENKAARIKRKKEEMLRIRALVDLAYNNDRRVQKFKNEEKERKLAAKRAKVDAAQAQKAEQERILKEAQLAKEMAQKAEQKRLEKLRIEREQIKKSLKKERKILRDKAKECKYFGNNDKDTLRNMEGIEKICETYNLVELQELNKKLDILGRDAFFIALELADEKLKAEIDKKTAKKQNEKSSKNDVKVDNRNEIWCTDHIQLLIKAFNLFPAGTSQRWDIIASFINQHSVSGVKITARDVLNKAKALQNNDFSKGYLTKQSNRNAFENFEKSRKDTHMSSNITTNNAVPLNSGSKNDESIEISDNKCNNSKKSCKTVLVKAWSKEEQTLLEQAIKSYPISTPDRWDRIAECIPNRTKKDCLRRVKDLVELVNSKQDARRAVN